MERPGKERYIEKIKRFSRVVCVLLQISFVVSVIVAAFIGCGLVFAGLPEREIVINGVTVSAPVLFEFGQTTITLPFADMDVGGLSILGGVQTSQFDGLVTGLLNAIAAIAAIVFAKRVFKKLRDGDDPFDEGVSRAVKNLAIAMLVLGVFVGAAGFLAAAIALAFYYVFGYGKAMQDELTANANR